MPEPDIHPVAQKVIEAMVQCAVAPKIQIPGVQQPHPAIEAISVALSAVFTFARDVGMPRGVVLDLTFMAMVGATATAPAPLAEPAKTIIS